MEHLRRSVKLIFSEVMSDQYPIDIFIALSEVGLGNERLTFVFSTVCLHWANSYEVHKCKTDSWVTAVIVDAVAKQR